MTAASAIALTSAAQPAQAQLLGLLAPRPLTSTADPAYGDINPFYGDISAFWGDINPFYGNIDAFYGDINPFYGNIDPFYGDISAFWGDINPFYGDINAFGNVRPAYDSVGKYWRDTGPLLRTLSYKLNTLGSSYASDTADYQTVSGLLNQLVNNTEAVFGKAVTARTGLSFRAGFADPLFARFGVKLNTPSTLQGVTDEEQAAWFFAWYDGLMDFTGVDHVDWWMSAVNWTPSITQIQGRGAGSVVGVLDATVAGDPDITSNLTFAGGYLNILNGHGTSVASLIVADHDGRGIMGIAPKASVVAYNPFDLTGTASFDDVKRGIVALKGAGASVINMSLGVQGWTLHPDWKGVFTGSTAAANDSTVYVLAAGNSGKSQTTNIAWDYAENPALIVVGSVGPTDAISSFSNRPGTACLLDAGVCRDGNRLMNRFIVAPGELILVSDGKGGLERRSGTSFAAPLVAGAITLLHDRWPWLANYPQETADIILRSAKDLGAPGTDSVYGRGMLDVAASQAPLDFSKATFTEMRNGVATVRTASSVQTSGLKSTWEADGVYFTLIEKIGATQRDFQVPMSSRLVGQTTTTNGTQEYFQAYVTSRLKGWITGTNGFTDVATNAVEQPGAWSFSSSTSMPAPAADQHRLAQSPHVSFRMEDPTRRFAFSAGHGQGAMVLRALPAFSLTRDYGSADGGVNPMLALASGGAFAAADFAIGKNTILSVGATQRTLVHEENAALDEIQRNALRNVDDYQAGAFDVRLTHRFSDRLSVTAGYASLRETNGLLGVQSIEPGDLAHGSKSELADVAASLDLGRGLTFAASASMGRSRTPDGADQAFASVGDVTSSAFAVAMSKQGLMGKSDLFRVSFTQPMHVERGKLGFSSVEVVDRATGEIGIVDRTFNIGATRRYVAETLYATPVLDGRGDLSLFGRAQFQAGKSAEELTVGTAFNVRF